MRVSVTVAVLRSFSSKGSVWIVDGSSIFLLAGSAASADAREGSTAATKS
jgi:hypothetical protein